MNTNLKNKSPEEYRSLKFEESNQLFNRNGNNGTCALMKSKRGISREINNSIKQSGVNSQSTQTNKATPRIDKGEINRLAEAWCELLLRQLQEEKTQLAIERAILVNTGENINKNNLEMSKTYAVTR